MLEDVFQVRFGSQDYGAIAEQMLEARYSSVTQQAYSQAPVDAGIKLAKLVRPVLERARSLPHSIAFGDSHSRNMFPLGSQAVGMDWMAVSSETTGVDIGVLIGSNLTFGVSKAAMIIDNEKKIYESYAEGIESTGSTGDLADLRIGFFTQFIGYLSTLAAVPMIKEDYRDRREFIKLRFGVELEELPEQVAPVIATIPKYVEEVKRLLG